LRAGARAGGQQQPRDGGGTAFAGAHQGGGVAPPPAQVTVGPRAGAKQRPDLVDALRVCRPVQILVETGLRIGLRTK
jgi:hypothetical protein